MKFAHTVKHNGIMYSPGQEVPIGVDETVSTETVEVKSLEDMKPGELVKYAEEKFGVKLVVQRGKERLLAEIAELEKGNDEDESDSESNDDENNEDEEQSEEESDESSSNDIETDEESSESDFVNSIINE